MLDCWPLSERAIMGVRLQLSLPGWALQDSHLDLHRGRIEP